MPGRLPAAPSPAAAPGGAPPAERSRSSQARLDEALEAAGVRFLPAAGGDLDGEALDLADAVLIDERSARAVAGWSDATLLALFRAVRAGKGLIAAGEGASALLRADGQGRFAGGGPGGPSAASSPREPGPEDGIAVEFQDQSHDLTQCVTHLFLEGIRPEPIAAGRAAGGLTLASALGPGGPVPFLWARNEGAGRAVFLAYSLRQGAAVDAGRDAALAFLISRAVQWAAGRLVTVRIPGDLPLAAERLGPRDAGTLPGLPPARGFYRARQIAPVMGFQAADWLARSDRAETELPDKVVESLSIEPGSTVADLGAGVGYFSFRLARRVGPAGKVLAVELQTEMLELFRRRLAEEGLRNVEPLLATETDPRLPPRAVDLVLLVDVYHELSRPAEVLAAVSKCLRPADKERRAGRLVLVEYRGEDPAVPIKPLHRMTVEQARAELRAAGFRWVETKDFLPHQHILVFENESSAPADE